MDSRKQPSPSSSNQYQFAEEINKLSQIIDSIKQNPSAKVSDQDAEIIKDSLNYLAAFNCGVDIMNAGQKDEYYCIYNQQSQSPIFFYGHHFKKPNLKYVEEMPGGLPAQNVYDRSSVLDANELQQLSDNLQHMASLRAAGVTRFIKGAFLDEMQKENCEAGFFAQTTVADPQKAIEQAVKNIAENEDKYHLMPIRQGGVASSFEAFKEDDRKTQQAKTTDKNSATYGAICKKGDEIIWGNIGDGLIGFEFAKGEEIKTITLVHEDHKERIGYFSAKGHASASDIDVEVDDVKFCSFKISSLKDELSEGVKLKGYELKRVFIASQGVCGDNYDPHKVTEKNFKNGDFYLHKTTVATALTCSGREGDVELSEGFNKNKTWLFPKKDALAFVVDVNEKDFIASVATGYGPRGGDVAKMVTQELQKQVGVVVEKEVLSKQQRLGALLEASEAVHAAMERSPQPMRKPKLPLSPISKKKDDEVKVSDRVAKLDAGTTRGASSSPDVSLSPNGPRVSRTIAPSKAAALIKNGHKIVDEQTIL